MKNRIIGVVFATLVLSCRGNDNVYKIETVLDSVVSAKGVSHTTVLIVGNSKTVKSQKHLADKYSSENKEIILTDIDFKNNDIIRYCFESYEPPFVFEMNNKGHIIRGSSESVKQRISFSPERIALLNLLIDETLLIESGDAESVNKYLSSQSVESREKDYFLCYNMMRLCSIAGRDEDCLKYKKKAVDLYINNPKPVLHNSFVSLLNSIDNTLVYTNSYNNIIDIGHVAKGAITDCVIPIHNASTDSLFIYQVTSSCSCISSQYDNIISGMSTGSIRLHYSASDMVGPFTKQLFLYTNITKKHIVLTIKGEQV